MAQLKTSLLLTLKDRLTAQVARVKRSFNDMAKAARLKGRLRLMRRQSRKLKQELNQLRFSVGKMAKRMGLIGGVAAGAGFGLFRLAKGTAAAGDKVAKTAKKLGMGVVDLQAWQFAAERSGVSTQTFDMALQRFTRRAREAADGTGEAYGALKYLNVQLKDSQGNLRDRTELLDDVAEALKGVEDPALRVRIAMKLFDSEGVSMVNMLADGKQATQDLRKEAVALGVISEENTKRSEAFADALTNFSQAASGLKNRLVGDLLPTLTQWMTAQTELIKSGKANFLSDLIAEIRVFVKQASLLLERINKVVKAIGGWKVVATALAALLGAKLIASIVGVIAVLSKMAMTAIPLVITAVKALAAAVMANPIAAIIAGIALAAVLIIRHWSEVKGFFKRLWQEVLGMFDDGFLKGIVRLLAAFNPVALVIKGFNKLLQYVAGISLADAGGWLMSSLQQGMQSAWQGVVNWFKGKVTGLLDLMPSALRSQLGLDKLHSSLTIQGGAPLPLPAQQVNADVGGLLKIRIDSTGQPRVAALEKHGGMDIEANTGVMMQGAG